MLKGVLGPEDEGTTLLRNVDKCLSVDMTNTSHKTRTFISTCGNLKSRISIPVPQCMLHRWILLKISSASAPAIMNMHAFFFYSTICFAFPSRLRCTDRGNFTTHARMNSAEDRNVRKFVANFRNERRINIQDTRKWSPFVLRWYCSATVR